MAIKRLTRGTLLHFQSSGDTAKFASGAKLHMLTGSQIVPNSGTQASSIAAVTVTGTYATDDTPLETAINSIITAIRGVGIIA